MADTVLVIKKYGNRRLYDTEASRYITLDDLSKLIQSGRDVKVVDAKSNADLTKNVLLQIISEQEKSKDLLPLSFLKRMIQLRDTALSDALQHYLSVSLETFLNTQQEFEQRYKNLAGNLMNPMMWMMPQLSQMANMGQAPPTPRAAPHEPPPPTEPEPAVDPEPVAAPATNQTDQETREQVQALKAQVASIAELLAKLDK